MTDSKMTIKDLKKIVDSFVNERNWKKFHSPKNLSMAISIEASELMELFQWHDLDQAKEVMKAGKIRDEALDEIADIFYYLVRISDKLNIDIEKALIKKMKKNRKKYPKRLVKGKAVKIDSKR